MQMGMLRPYALNIVGRMSWRGDSAAAATPLLGRVFIIVFFQKWVKIGRFGKNSELWTNVEAEAVG